ncbi:MAG: hypothetical protein H8D45_00990 [Bacteroidetes bacterium]|nr:hypothetical protein [Bacteroidota bacterium]
MKKLFLVLLLVFIAAATTHSKPAIDDLSPFKMEMTTAEILDLFTSPDKDKLRDYISEKWLEEEGLDVNIFKINNYYPDFYNILFSTSDVVIAEIGGDGWTHVLIFKFTDEDGEYRVIPKGISMASEDYIDPWWDVWEYICREPIDDFEN